MNPSPIINTEDLLKIYKNNDVLIFDVSNSKNALDNYNSEHLEGAYFVDLNTQLAEIKNDVSLGGRHPLPSVKNFCKTLNRLGISKKNHIVVYDDKNGSNAAARFWWMLKAVGHKKVQVLNGGFGYAKKIGFPLSSNIEVIKQSSETYSIEAWILPTVSINEIENISEDSNYKVIDVRDKERFDGKKEPIDLIAGHIPGAINFPFTENLDSNGLFLKSMELKNKYSTLFENTILDNISIHCGSGVTACHTLLALDYAGFSLPNLYVGSWSEWSRNNKKIEVTN